MITFLERLSKMVRRFYYSLYRWRGTWPGLQTGREYAVVRPACADKTRRATWVVSSLPMHPAQQLRNAEFWLTKARTDAGLPPPDWPPLCEGFKRIDETLSEHQRERFSCLLVRAQVIGVDAEVVDLWRTYVTKTGPENSQLPIGTRLRLMEQRLDNWERVQ